MLLNRTPDYLPWLKWLVLIGGLAGALGMVFVARLGRQLALATVAVSFVTALAGPTAYTLSTVNSAHTGSIPTAGPAGASSMGFGGRGGGPGGGTGGFPGGGQNQQQNGNGSAQGQNQQGGMPGGGMGEGGMGGGAMGGLLNGATVSAKAKELLEKDADKYTWAAAAIGSQNAASYQLATEKPVMAIGGFNGTDPSPTLAQFKKYVADGKIHYFIGGSGMGGGMGSSSGSSSKISSWVESNFKKVTVGSATFYDLTQPTSGS